MSSIRSALKKLSEDNERNRKPFVLWPDRSSSTRCIIRVRRARSGKCRENTRSMYKWSLFLPRTVVDFTLKSVHLLWNIYCPWTVSKHVVSYTHKYIGEYYMQPVHYYTIYSCRLKVSRCCLITFFYWKIKIYVNRIIYT